MNCQFRTAATFFALALLSACGSSQSSTDAPADPAAIAPAQGDAPDDGEHTMPDGTKMPGDQHGDHGEHTMPEGTKMPGDQHGEHGEHTMPEGTKMPGDQHGEAAAGSGK